MEDAKNWQRRLQEQYPEQFVTEVKVSGRGFRVVYSGDVLCLQHFMVKYKKMKIPPIKIDVFI
ncbi:hypothetical protein [Klebsiella variicola]|nr:hypothetical protein [Klebsiella variicola]MEC6197821.1 hypothetical protein [Klebsiella variicola]HCQ8411075.1 hypothetical protein [Klebsiella variicola]